MCADKRSAPPTAQDAARRLIALRHVAVYARLSPDSDVLKATLAKTDKGEQKRLERAVIAARDAYWGSLRDAKLWDVLTPLEQNFARKAWLTMDPEVYGLATWCGESLHVLAWALGLVKEFPAFDVKSTLDPRTVIPTPDLNAFISSASLRPETEIRRARDLAELWHWRRRTRQRIEARELLIPTAAERALGVKTYEDAVRYTARKLAEQGTIITIEEDMAALGKPYRALSAKEFRVLGSIAGERHRMLNWLCGYAPKNQWDVTPTNT